MTNFLPRWGRVLLLLAFPFAAQAQNVGIGTTAPNASAALDIVSTTKGVLLPRVASTGSVASPATGLIVFQTNSPAGYYYNTGTAAAPVWQQLVTTGSPAFIQNQSAAAQAGSFSVNGTGVAGSVQATGSAPLAISTQGTFLQ